MLAFANKILNTPARALVMLSGRETVPEQYAMGWVERGQKYLHTTHNFSCDNIREFHSSKDFDPLDYEKDFPNCMPQFDLMFFEWTDHGTQEGALLASQPLTEETCEVAFSKLTGTALEKVRNSSLPVVRCIEMQLFLQFKGAARCFPFISAIFVNSAGGCVCRAMLGHEEVIDIATRIPRRFIDIPLLAINFMNCKNVIKKDVTAEHSPSEKWCRRQKQPRLRYHVLDINPMREVLRTEGGSETNGIKKALHICRGHFVTYTEEKPLFGHIAGTFWKPAHVRGNEKNGIVDKDYRIHSGGEGAA